MRRTAWYAVFLVCLCSCGGGGQSTTALPVAANGSGAQNASRAALPDAKRQIASLAIKLSHVALPIGEMEGLSVTAFDASGQPIVGSYDNPIVLSAPDVTFSQASLNNSTAASTVTVAWNNGLTHFGDVVLTARADGKTATANLVAASGLEFYYVGTDPNTDAVGLRTVFGPDGDIYYGTFGPTTCGTDGFCYSTQGSISRLDPSTGLATEIPIASEVSGLYFSSDGALWFGGGPNGPIYRMPPGTFSAADIQTIALPAGSPGAHQVVDGITADTAGNIWFTDASGHRYYRIPEGGPYITASITPYSAPSGPANTLGGLGNLQGIALSRNGSLYAADFVNGTIDKINATSGAVTRQYVTPQQEALGSSNTTEPRFLSGWNGNTLFLSQLNVNGSASTLNGGIDVFDPSGGAFPSTITLPQSPTVGSVPDSLATQGRYVYFADLANGLGVFDAAATRTSTSVTARIYPVVLTSGFNPNGTASNVADGVAVDSRDNAWFTCYNGTSPFTPLCIGRTVYRKTWGILPTQDITLSIGAAGAQLFGIVEPPGRDTSPFAITTTGSVQCSASSVGSHNFLVTGNSATTAGQPCIVTVLDSTGLAQTVNVTVIANGQSATNAARARTGASRIGLQ